LEEKRGQTDVTCGMRILGTSFLEMWSRWIGKRKTSCFSGRESGGFRLVKNYEGKGWGEEDTSWGKKLSVRRKNNCNSYK